MAYGAGVEDDEVGGMARRDVAAPQAEIRGGACRSSVQPPVAEQSDVAGSRPSTREGAPQWGVRGHAVPSELIIVPGY